MRKFCVMKSLTVQDYLKVLLLSSCIFFLLFFSEDEMIIFFSLPTFTSIFARRWNSTPFFIFVQSLPKLIKLSFLIQKHVNQFFMEYFDMHTGTCNTRAYQGFFMVPQSMLSWCLSIDLKRDVENTPRRVPEDDNDDDHDGKLSRSSTHIAYM